MRRAAETSKTAYLNQKLATPKLPLALLEHVDLGVCVVDARLNVVAINEPARKILDFPADLIRPGLTLETLVRYNAARGDFGDGNVEELVRERLELARTVINDSFEFTQPDGSTIQVKRTLLPDGGFVTTYAADTVSKPAQPAPSTQHTEPNRAPLDDIIGSMGQGVILWNADQCCEIVNRRTFELLDLDETFLKVGMSRAEFLELSSKRGDLSETELDYVKQSFARNERFSFDRTTPSGRIIKTDVRPRSDGGFVVTFSDMTELRQREAELVEATQAAEAAARAKSEFLANMSHEIRTPMNGVIGMAELLAKTSLDNKQQHFANTIVKSGQALLAIINDILDFSKIEAGQMAIKAEPFEIAEAIEDVATLMSTHAAEKGIELVVRVQPDLPNSLVGDAGRLRQIITSLIGNAVKFTDDGHVLADVSGSVEDNMAHLTISIEDTGIGIPEDKLDLIFEQFAQADTSATRSHEGTGLGLAISSRLISLMGGQIDVDSKPGEGSCFALSISLPVHENVQKTKQAPVDVSGASILIIDDNEINQTILLEQMAAWQFEADAAGSGSEGLDLLNARESAGAAYDLVILDYHMPTQNGLEVAVQIRKSTQISATPILMLTSVEHADINQQLSQLAIDAHLTKPARSSLLLETMIEVLQQNARRQPVTPIQSPKSKTTDEATMRILFAEDNEVNHEVFLELMEGEPYDVTGVWDGREAVVQYIADPGAFDVIVLDMAMPLMSGFEATEAIRAHERVRHITATPIIGASAHATDDHRRQALAAGMDDYLVKPINVDEFLACLSRWHVKRVVADLNETAEKMAAATDEPVLTMADIVRRYGRA